jgi:hypothetical protein
MNAKPKNLIMENITTNMWYRNFAGVATKKNAEGSRNFNIEIPADLAQQLNEEGWNVRYREDKDIWLLKVHVSYQFKKPIINLVTSNNGRVTPLTERTIANLDYSEIECYDVNIEPSNKTYLNGEGRETHSAYLKSMNVYIADDPIANKFNTVVYQDDFDEE